MTIPIPDLAVQLRAAKIPAIAALAHHHWFVIERAGVMDRWEVWQRPDVGVQSWGHVHKNLMHFDRGVGHGASWVVHRWSAEAAASLCARIESSPRDYPWCARYRLWPGPNSNTYVQWILAGEHRLGWKAWGRNYRRNVT